MFCLPVSARERCGLFGSIYLSFVEHLQVESLDLVELKPQRCQCVLLLMRVLLQQLHGHLHLLLQAHLELQLTLQLLTQCIAI